MRVEDTDGKKQEIGLYLDPPTAVKVLEKVRSLQPYKPWQFKTGESFCLILLNKLALIAENLSLGCVLSTECLNCSVLCSMLET